MLFENVGFGDASDYVDLAPGTYGLDLRRRRGPGPGDGAGR